jgi:hypothetical protein
MTLRSAKNDLGDARELSILRLISRFRRLRSPEVAVLMGGVTDADYNQYSRCCRRMLDKNLIGELRLPMGMGSSYFIKRNGKRRLIEAGVPAGSIRAFDRMTLPRNYKPFHDIFAVHCFAWAVQWVRTMLFGSERQEQIIFATEPELRRKAARGEHVPDFSLRFRSASMEWTDITAEVEWAEKDGKYARAQAESIVSVARSGYALVFIPVTRGVDAGALKTRQARYLNDLLRLLYIHDEIEERTLFVTGAMTSPQSMRPTFTVKSLAKVIDEMSSSGLPVSAQRRRDALTARFHEEIVPEDGVVRLERIDVRLPVYVEFGEMESGDSIFVSLVHRHTGKPLFHDFSDKAEGNLGARHVGRRWLIDESLMSEHLTRNGFDPVTGERLDS